ncbi:sensor histidine kinase [Rothia nasisuis]|uniref:sensor histidine kinase n=1 Tax=Rothia nasisuis TaxID=2109647 RepID=UPI001F30C130|nr:sensor histidine kinase [Rothia nasisuis]
MTSSTRFSFSQIDPDWERPAPSPASLRKDVLIWLVVLVVTLLLNAAYHSAGLLGDDSEQIRNSYWAAAGMTLPLAARRRFPLTMMLVATLLFFVLSYFSVIASATLSYQLSYFAVLYAGLAWGKNRAMTWIVYALICLIVLLWFVMGWVVTDAGYQIIGIEDYQGGLFIKPTASYVMVIFTNVFYFGCAAIMGRTAWSQAYQRTILSAQAQQLEAQSAQMAEDAVTRDRLRIARELHDSVGHHVSSMGVQAAAARRALEKKPELAAEPLANIEKLARSSVTEMKNLIRVLRASGEDEHSSGTSKEPQVVDILSLASPTVTGNLSVTVQVSSEDLTMLSTLQQGTQLSMYRMVQEALTNARKHSAAQRVVIALRTGGSTHEGWAELEVTDDGPGVGSNSKREGSLAPTSTHQGYGVQGIRERAAALGGTSCVGRREGTEGWRVQVRFPATFDTHS